MQTCTPPAAGAAVSYAGRYRPPYFAPAVTPCPVTLLDTTHNILGRTLTGADVNTLLASGVAQNPSPRSTSLAGTKLRWGPSGTSEDVVLRLPISTPPNTFNGDTLKLTGVLNFEPYSGTDLDLSMSLSDGARAFGGMSYDQDQGYTFIGCDRYSSFRRLASAGYSHSRSGMPVTFVVEVAPTGTTVSIKDHQGTLGQRIYKETLDLARDLEILISVGNGGERLQLVTATFNAEWSPGPAIMVGGLSLLTCPHERTHDFSGPQLNSYISANGKWGPSLAHSVSGSKLTLNPSASNALLFTVPFVSAGTVSFNDDFSVQITVAWTRDTGDNDPIFGITDGVRFIAVQSADNSGGQTIFKTGSISSSTVSHKTEGDVINVAQSQPLTFNFRFSKDQTDVMVVTNAGAVVHLTLYVTLQLGNTLSYMLAGGDHSEQYSITTFTTTWNHEQSLFFPLVSTKYTGAQLFDMAAAGQAEFPTTRAVSKTSNGVLFNAGGFWQDVLLRVPLLNGHVVNNGDTLRVEVTIDFKPNAGDNDMAFGISDGARIIAAVTRDQNDVDLYAACDEGTIMTNTVYLQPNKGSHAFAYKPVYMSFDISATGTVIVVTDGEGTTVNSGFVPYTLDIGRDLSFVLVGEHTTESFEIKQVAVQASVQPGQAVDLDSTMLKTCTSMSAAAYTGKELAAAIDAGQGSWGSKRPHSVVGNQLRFGTGTGYAVMLRYNVDTVFGVDVVVTIRAWWTKITADSDPGFALSDGTNVVGSLSVDENGGGYSLFTATDNGDTISKAQSNYVTGLGQDLPVTVTIHATASGTTVTFAEGGGDGRTRTFSTTLDLTKQLQVLLVGGNMVGEQYGFNEVWISSSRGGTVQQGVIDRTVQLQPRGVSREVVLYKQTFDGKSLLFDGRPQLKQRSFTLSGTQLTTSTSATYDEEWLRIPLAPGGQVSQDDTLTLTFRLDFGQPQADFDFAFGLVTGTLHVGFVSEDNNGDQATIMTATGTSVFGISRKKFASFSQTSPYSGTLTVTRAVTSLTVKNGAGQTVNFFVATNIDVRQPIEYFMWNQGSNEKFTIKTLQLDLTRKLAAYGDLYSRGFSGPELFDLEKKGDVSFPNGGASLKSLPGGAVLRLTGPSQAHRTMMRIPVIAEGLLTSADSVTFTITVDHDEGTSDTDPSLLVSDGSQVLGFRQTDNNPQVMQLVTGCDSGLGLSTSSAAFVTKGYNTLLSKRNRMTAEIRLTPFGGSVTLADTRGERAHSHAKFTLDMTKRLDVIWVSNSPGETFDIREFSITASRLSTRQQLVVDRHEDGETLMRNGRVVLPSPRIVTLNTDNSLSFGAGNQNQEIIMRYPISDHGVFHGGDSVAITVEVSWGIDTTDNDARFALTDGVRMLGVVSDDNNGGDLYEFHGTDGGTVVNGETRDTMGVLPRTMPLTIVIKINPYTGGHLSVTNGAGDGLSGFTHQSVDVTRKLEFLFWVNNGGELFTVRQLNMKVTRYSSLSNVISMSPYYTFRELDALDDPGLTFPGSRTRTLSGYGCKFQGSASRSYEYLLRQKIADSGSFAADETLAFNIRIDWVLITSDNDVDIGISDGTNVITAHIFDNDGGGVAASSSRESTSGSTKYLTSKKHSSSTSGFTQRGPYTITILRKPASHDISMSNVDGEIRTRSISSSLDVTKELFLIVTLGNTGEQIQINSLAWGIRRFLTSSDAVFSRSYTGRELFYSGDAYVPSRKFKISGDRIDFDAGKSYEVLYRVPILPFGSMTDGDKLIVEVTVAWSNLGNGDNDVLFHISDGIHTAALMSIDNSGGELHYVRGNEVQTNEFTTITQSDRVTIKTGFTQSKPFKLRYEITSTTRKVTGTNRDGLTGSYTHAYPFTMENEIDFVVTQEGSGEKHGVEHVSIEAFIEAGGTAPAQVVDSRCCSDIDFDGVCDSSDKCWGPDASGDSDNDGVCDSWDACRGNDCGGDWDDDGVCDTVVDCEMTAWSAWSACQCNSIGTMSTQTRSRSVKVSPQNGGVACPAETGSRTCADTTPPTINCPQSFIVQYTTSAPSRDTKQGVTASDNSNCAPVISCSPSNVNQLGLGAGGLTSTNTIVCSARDIFDLSSSCSYVVTVKDNVDPQITCQGPSVITKNTDAGQNTATVQVGASASDNSGKTTVTCSPSSGKFALGDTSVTCTASDPSHNEASCSLTVRVTDAEAPKISCPSSKTVSTGAGSKAAKVTFVNPTASDNVGVASLQCSKTSGSSFALGKTTVTCTAKDAAQLSSQCSFDITVEDNEKPVVQCPQPISRNTDLGKAYATTSWSTSATDNVDASVSVLCNPGSGARFSVGSTTVTCRASDAAGNQGSCTFSVTVSDNEKPAISCPTQRNVNTNTGLATGTATWSVSVTDNADAAPSSSCSPPAGYNSFSIGSNTVTCTASDKYGNSNTCSFSVVVSDAEQPRIACPGGQTVSTTLGKATAQASWSAPVVSDNSGASLSPSCSPTSPATFGVGDNDVVCTVSDPAGNSNTCQFVVTVSDTESPKISCPVNIDVPTEAGKKTAAPGFAPPTATDNIQVTQLSCDKPNDFTFPLGSTTVTCTAEDAAGNNDDCSFSVRVEDEEKPEVSCPGDFTKNPDAGTHNTAITWSNTATDNVDSSPSVTCDAPSGSRFTVGSKTVTCSATDAAGNTGSCSFEVTIKDEEGPEITCPSTVTVNTNAGQATGTASWASPDVKDNVDTNPSVSCSPASGSSAFELGNNQVVCTATDKFDNSEHCTFTVVVNDREPPKVSCPDDQSLSAEQGKPTTLATFGDPTTSDNTDRTVLTSCSPPSGSAFSVGSNTVTCTATDPDANKNQCTFAIVVTDDEAPEITCPADVAASTDAGFATAKVAPLPQPSGSDNVGVKTIGCDRSSGDAFDLGVTTVTCTVEDAAGNGQSCQFKVTVTDNEKPVVACPADKSASTETGTDSAALSWTTSVTDNVDQLKAECEPGSGSRFAVGTTNVVCSAADKASNVGECSFKVTVTDDEDPSIECPFDATFATLAGQATGQASWSSPVVLDNVDPNPAVSCSHTSGDSTFPIGPTTVACTATDAAGNDNSCSFTVTVEDREKPTLTCPANMQVPTTATTNDAAVSWSSDFQQADNSGDEVTVTCNPISGSTLAMGPATSVTCTAVDTSSNTATCSFDVHVLDKTAPVVSGCPSSRTITLPSAVTTGGEVVASWTVPSATDNSGADVQVTCDRQPSEPLSLTAEGEAQDHTVSCSVTDPSGNTNSECSFTLRVEDAASPVVQCPPAVATTTDVDKDSAEVTWQNDDFQADDNSGAALTRLCSPPSGSAFSVGSTSVTCTATDKSGNSQDCKFLVGVADKQAPTVTSCPASDIEQATDTGKADAVVTFAAPAASDAVDGVVSASVSDSPANAGLNSGSTFPLGTTDMTFSFTDQAGNAAECAFSITVVDEERPTVSGCPNSQTVPTDAGSRNALVSFAAPSAIDNVDGPVVGLVTVNGENEPNLKPEGTFFRLGKNTVEYTFSDEAGNADTCSFSVTVEDKEKPVVTNCPPDIETPTTPGTATMPGNDTAVVSWETVVASDNVDLTLFASSVQSTPATGLTRGSVFPLGVTAMQLRFVDTSGNEAMCSFTVSVVDEEAPVVYDCPSNVAITLGVQEQSKAAFWQEPHAVDNVDGKLNATLSNHQSGKAFGAGLHGVEYFFSDAAGNSAVCKFTVTVKPPCANDACVSVSKSLSIDSVRVDRWLAYEQDVNNHVVLTMLRLAQASSTPVHWMEFGSVNFGSIGNTPAPTTTTTTTTTPAAGRRRVRREKVYGTATFGFVTVGPSQKEAQIVAFLTQLGGSAVLEELRKGDTHGVFEASSSLTGTPPTVSKSEASRGSSSSAGIPAIAGGAAAFFILLLLAVVLVRRHYKNKQRPANNPDGAKARNVVAFTNPIYGDSNSVERPSYQEGGMDHRENPIYDADMEGLYDNPEDFGFNDQGVDGYLDFDPGHAAALGGQHGGQDDDDGLYDDPTFSGPHTEQFGGFGFEEGADDGDEGGYLDVKPGGPEEGQQQQVYSQIDDDDDDEEGGGYLDVDDAN